VALSLRVKWPGREADHSPPSSADGKYTWSYKSNTLSWRGAQLKEKHRDNCTFTLTVKPSLWKEHVQIEDV